MLRSRCEETLVLTVAALLAAACMAQSAAAASLSLTVNTASDTHDLTPGDGVCADSSARCSLRAAVEEADARPAGSTIAISVPAGTYTLSLGALAVSANTLSVSGAATASTVLKGKGSHQLITVAAGASLTLKHLTLTHANALTKTGGALDNNGSASLLEVAVSGSQANLGGGIYNADGATLTLRATSVTGNMTAMGAAGKAGGDGGGIWNGGALTATGGSVRSNFAGSGGSSWNGNPGARAGAGGGIWNGGALKLTRTKVTTNGSGSGGVGINEVSGNGGDGGGIYTQGASTILDGVTISANTTGGPGFAETGDGIGRGGNGGGIYNASSLHLSTSRLSGNSSGPDGNGGGIYNRKTTIVSASTLDSNATATGEAASGNGGAIDNTGTLSITNSTLGSNVTGTGGTGSGGGDGGALYNGAGSATISGSIFEFNATGPGGNGYDCYDGCFPGGPGGNGGSGGSIWNGATLNITNSTLTGGTTGAGGAGGYQLGTPGRPGLGGGIITSAGKAILAYATVAGNAGNLTNHGGSLQLSGTIAANSTSGPECAGTISEGAGHNLDSGTSCAFTGPGDVNGADPKLGSLAANGGPAKTMALLAGSPAIDAGGSAATGCPTTDQRGMPRPDEAADNGACDIGAYESKGTG